MRRDLEKEESVLVLQGGGALGAYQAGVFEALSDIEVAPDWVAGISIGAINCAIIAGNAPERRLERLRQFWHTVSAALPAPLWTVNGRIRAKLHEASALRALLLGAPGFFAPRVPPPPFWSDGTIEAISYYDTGPLERTLTSLVDFDLLNSGPVRLSVGAVNVRTGNFAYFDSAKQRIDARHIMASGALPPGFAPVQIDDEYYWDGGLVSNTPLQYVVDSPAHVHRVVFQVDLFPARGELPLTIGEVSEREKEIRYSSRTRLNTDIELERQRLAQAAQRLLLKLPPQLRDDPDARALAGLPECKGVDIVHLIYRSQQYETHAKDWEFSQLSMQEHWQAGSVDMSRTLNDPRWANRERNAEAIRVFDLTRDSSRADESGHERRAVHQYHDERSG
jgi:NTE family protein